MRAVRTALRGTAHDGAMSPAPDAAAVEAPTGDDPATAVDATAAPGTDARPDPVIDAAAVDAAAARLEGVVTRTPLRAQRAPVRRAPAPRSGSSARTCRSVRSYKLRGAYNLMAQLDAGRAGARRGVRQRRQPRPGAGLRLPAARACTARVYLPRTTPRQKRERIAALGGGAVEVVVGGRHLRRGGRGGRTSTRRRPGRPWCPPSTTPARSPARARSRRGRRAARRPRRTSLVVPVGGGGLLAGSLAWLRERHPAVRVVGVEPAGAAVHGGGARRRAAAWSWPTSTPSSTARPCGGRATLTYPLVRGRAARSWSPSPRAGSAARCSTLYQSDGIIAEPAGRAGVRRAGRRRRRRARASRGVRAVRRQQRRQPLRRDRRAGAGARGPQALLPRRLPAGAGRAAPVPGRGARAGRRHHAVRVRQAQQPRDRAGAGRHRARRAARTWRRCWRGWRPRRRGSSRSPADSPLFRFLL